MSLKCPIHRHVLAPYWPDAMLKVLEAERARVGYQPSGPTHVISEIELQAWHLYWAQTSEGGHDPGDEDRREADE